jgi:hypothetical protein
MALPVTKGVAHIFGLRGTGGTVFTVQSDDISSKPALDVEIKDETGRVITDRLDDLRIDISVEGVLLSTAILPSIGNSLVYNGVTYIIKEVTDRGTNQDFRKLSVRAVKYQEIDNPPPTP